ncbi:hypothetical protein HK104_000186 [Borealophlyctis nickersoniae]|nr:hypothetical protein HK104_000186 [Borealophlyctis nickersoniae]
MPTQIHSLNLLPQTLLDQILHLSANPSLVFVSRTTFVLLSNSISARAAFLLGIPCIHPSTFLAEAVKWRICTPEVLRLVLRRGGGTISVSTLALSKALKAAAQVGRVPMVEELLRMYRMGRHTGEDGLGTAKGEEGGGGDIDGMVLEEDEVAPKDRTLAYFHLTLLREGCRHLPLIRYLFEKEQVDLSSTPALYWAAHGGRVDVAEYILTRGLDIPSQLCMEASLVSCQRGDIAMLDTFVQHGLDRGSDNLLMYEGITHNQLGIVEYLLSKCRVDPNILISETHESALVVAAEMGRVAVCAALVQAGANVHFGSDLALAVAAKQGHLAVVVYLCEGGGANATANLGEAGRLAQINGHKDVVQYLGKMGGFQPLKACRWGMR